MSEGKFIVFFSLMLTVINCFAQNESITITTYYPSPFGVYNELRAKKMSIGDNYYDPASTSINDPADLIVEGNVGIGLPNPQYKFQIADGGKVITLTTHRGYTGLHIGDNPDLSGSGGGIWYQDSTNTMAVTTNGKLDLSTWGQAVTFQTYMGGNVGIGADPGSYRLYVAGDIYATVNVISSDIRFKDVTEKELSGILDKITKLRPVKFKWKREEFPQKGFPEGEHFGLIAQDVEKYFPEVVSNDDAGYKALSYDELVPLLVQAVKELKAEIDELKKDNEEIRRKLEK